MCAQHAISPTIAASLADGVYGVREVSNISQAVAERLGSVTPGVEAGPQPMGVSELFDAFEVQGTAVTGVSGAPMLTKSTGFGMVLKGKGRFKGDLAVVCRGTATWRDWLTDFNAGLAPGPGNYPVHTGFARTYNRMRPGMNDGIRKLSPNPTNIHVVGHSLGGALATLFAGQFVLEKRANVHLYTFGSPRAGTMPFTSMLEEGLTGGRMKRVYALADVVPMVPIFPFSHTAGGLRTNRGGQFLSINSHLMTNYMPAVFGRSWSALSVEDRGMMDFKSIDSWLDYAIDFDGRPFSSTMLWALGKALKGILAIIKAALGTALTATITIIDGIAMALAKGVRFLGDQISSMVRRLVQGVMRFMNRAWHTVGDITERFLRYMLELLFDSMAQIARGAMAVVHR
ncbi:MAG: lipase family protein [Pseudomonadota bacterium]